MKQVLLSIAFALLTAVYSSAENVDRIETLKGDTYAGYISYQVPGKTLTIMSSETIVTVASKDTHTRNGRRVQLAELPDEQIVFFPYLNDEDYVECVDLFVEEGNGREVEFRGAYILEDGDEIKFVSFTPTSVSISWDSIRSYGKVVSAGDTGLMDVLMLPNAERIEGQLLERNLKKHIIKFRMKDGKIRTYRKSEVQSLRTEATDPQGNIWEKLPYCDEITLKNGSTMDGFIVAKQLGKQITMMQYNTTVERTIQNNEIVSYGRHPNPLYKKAIVKDSVVVTPGLYINGKVYDVYDIISFKNKAGKIDVPTDSLAKIVKVGEKVVVKMKINARTSQIRIAKCVEKKETLTTSTGFLSKNEKTVQYKPYFNSDSVLEGVDVNFQINDGDYITLDFVPAEAGIYAVYAEDQKVCALFKVEEK